MTSALVRTSGESREMAAFDPQYIETVERVADKLARSGMFPNRNKEQLAVIIMQGHELGLGTMQAANGIYVTGGKAALKADLAVALVRNSGRAEYFRLVSSSPTEATWVTKRVGDPEEDRATFTMEDANAAGLLNNPTYKKYPARMLEWRAAMVLARRNYSDVLLGLYAVEELDGGPIEARIEAEDNQPTAPLLAAKNDGPGGNPVLTRAASNEPSKGGATLRVSTREVVAAVAAALPDGNREWFDLDKIKAMTKAFATPEMLGEAAVREMAKGFGEPKRRTPEQWDAFRRALETRWQETLNNASTDRWDLYVKGLGETVTDEIAAMVSDHEGQPPEDWTAEQLLRALRMAEKRQGDVPQ